LTAERFLSSFSAISLTVKYSPLFICISYYFGIFLKNITTGCNLLNFCIVESGKFIKNLLPMVAFCIDI
jgi:hypothetical protein